MGERRWYDLSMIQSELESSIACLLTRTASVPVNCKESEHRLVYRRRKNLHEISAHKYRVLIRTSTVAPTISRVNQSQSAKIVLIFGYFALIFVMPELTPQLPDGPYIIHLPDFYLHSTEANQYFSRNSVFYPKNLCNIA